MSAISDSCCCTDFSFQSYSLQLLELGFTIHFHKFKSVLNEKSVIKIKMQNTQKCFCESVDDDSLGDTSDLAF